MIILVPVSRFRVNYEVAEGSPYSQLERLVLRAVNDNIASKDELVKTFRIPSRLLIESLITLIHTGWVALGRSQEKQFILTPEGKRALNQDQLPELVKISSRHTFVLVERITGGVIPEGEVRYVPKNELRKKRLWESCVQIPANVLDNKLDEGQVQYLLPRRQGERLHWVGPIDMVSKGSHYIPVGVDLESESIVNLPPRYETRLRPSVLEAAREELSRKTQENILTWEDLTREVKVGYGRAPISVETSGLPRRDWSVRWSPNDLLFTSDQHVELLHQILEKAQTLVLITSSIAELQRLEYLKPAMLSALKRGVDIDLLWGYAMGRDSLEWMKKLAYDIRRDNGGGNLRYNHSPANCNAKMVLWDEGQDVFKAAIGSYDWLAHRSSGDRGQCDTQFTVRISHPAILSVLSWCAAGLWSGSRSESLSSTPDRWRRIATDLEAQVHRLQLDVAAEDANQVTLRIVLDSEHPVLIREWAATAQDRLLITTSKLDKVAEKLLLPVCEHNHADGFTYRILYGQSDLGEGDIVSLQEIITRASGVLRCIPQIGGNTIVSDQSACISSFSFLSRPSQKEIGSREVGIMIDGTKPANQISTHLLRVMS